MSALIAANAPFLTLLLNTTKKQRHFLLKTASWTQQRSVLEILFNILMKSVDATTSKDKVFFKKYKRFLSNFDSTKSEKKKIKLLSKNVKKIFIILDYFKEKIIPLL